MMTREEIAGVRAKQIEINSCKDYSKQKEELRKLNDDLGLSKAFSGNNDPEIVLCYNEKINSHLQTEMMRIICESAEKSCKSAEKSSKTAKWSCFWAAVSAFLVFVSIFLMMCP
jgi:hypothetical protein